MGASYSSTTTGPINRSIVDTCSDLKLGSSLPRSFPFMLTSPTIAMMAERNAKKPRGTGTARRRRKPAGTAIGLATTELQAAAPPGDVAQLHHHIESDGGTVLAVYREPYGGRWMMLAALPIERVAATPFQRNLSDTHVRKSWRR